MTWAYTIETDTMETQPLQEIACWETTTTAENRVELYYNRSPAEAMGSRCEGGWNRYYDPLMGMYTQTDKVNEISGGRYLDSISFNPEIYGAYTYAALNPIGYIGVEPTQFLSGLAGCVWL